MNWHHIQLIFFRELRDQLRDRRTMFTICALPMLLYPLMGLLMLQLAQVKTPQRFSIAVAGTSEWLNDSGAEADIQSHSDSTSNESLRWTRLPDDAPVVEEIYQKLKLQSSDAQLSDEPSAATDTALVEDLLRRADADAILCVIPKSASSDSVTESHPGDIGMRPEFLILSNQRWERSRLTVSKLQSLVERWHHRWIRHQLESQNIGRELWEAPRILHLDSASTAQRQAVVWSKILPFIMLVWALTGAFYPAVDLCAGEKERGTLETLLSSPASRREIVWGKLLTIMCFSVATAILNLSSIYITTSFVFKHFSLTAQNSTFSVLGPISFDLIFWLILLVIPMSAMFSALSLAVASLARSTKEGQYYLMPLMLVGFPLVMLPVLPGMTLSSGTSIVPITGAVLLSRAFMDGEYGLAFGYLPSVLCVTALCCLLATRWAVRQFENESVLFSEIDKGSMKHWLIRLWTQRTSHPSATESVVGGLTILVALFFGRLALGTEQLDWRSIATSTVVIQIGILLGPTLIMAVMLTRSLQEALRWNTPRVDDLVVCSLLAFCLHPTYVRLAEMVHRAYPLGPETAEVLKHFDSILTQVPLWSVLVVFALLPALCEELLFRGFIFAGLLENKGVLRAVIGSSVLFGLSHGVLQQSICATAMGLILGWMAYRTGGIACTFAFHLLHNSISMTLASWSATGHAIPYWISWGVERLDGACMYTNYWTNMSLAVSLVLLFWLSLRSPKNAVRPSHSFSDVPRTPLQAGATISSNSMAGSPSQ